MDAVLSPFDYHNLVQMHNCSNTSPFHPQPVTNEYYHPSNMNDSISQLAQSNHKCGQLLGQIDLIRNVLNQKYQERGLYGAMGPPAHLEATILESDKQLYTFKTQLMQQIKNSREILKFVMQKLIEQLVEWLIKQKEISCGPRYTVKSHYDLLDGMDEQFEECGGQIATLIHLVNQAQAYIDTSTPDLFAQVQRYLHDLIQSSKHFVWQSLIIAVQPPVVLVKCRGSDSYRSTRFPCKTEVRLLGGKALGVRENASEVRVDIISEEVARKIQQDPCQPVTNNQSFHLIYNEARFQTDHPALGQQSQVYRASFERIRLVENAVATKRGQSGSDTPVDEKKGTRRSKVSSLRYYLAYKIQLTGHPYLVVGGYKLSLPVAALVHSSLEAEASLFWNRSFAEGTGILTPVPDIVPWHKVQNALNLKFMSLVQEPQDVKDLAVDLPEPRPLSEQNLGHLAERLCVANNMVHKKNFFNKTIAHKKNQDGSPVQCVFYEWFYKCASIVNKYMQTQWDDGLITGFCSKEDSERNLCMVAQPTMLIRFSDMVNGHLKISCKLADHRIVHYETDADEMPDKTSIGDAIRSNPTFAFIQNIFPNKRVSLLWQDKEVEEDISRGESWVGVVPPGYIDTTIQLTTKPVAAP